jgi:membrane-bound ClpP family serine protease
MGWLIVLGKIAFLVPTGFAVVHYLKRKQLTGKLILNETLAEDKADVVGLEYFVGKEGVTKTALRPFGTADFNGSSIEVCADTSKYIAVNKRVRVIDVKERKVFVVQADTN